MEPQAEYKTDNNYKGDPNAWKTTTQDDGTISYDRVREEPAPKYALKDAEQSHGGLKDLQDKFINQKKFPFDKEVEVDGIRYTKSTESDHAMSKMITEGAKGVIGYGTRYRELARSKGLSDYILFLWGVSEGGSVLAPFKVMSVVKTDSGKNWTDAEIKKYRDNDRIIEDEAKINISKDKLIGSTVEVFISNIPGMGSIQAKVDTGADISSIHADEWNVDNGQVTFTNTEISQNKITLPVLEQQAIKTSNGEVEYRPVVSLNVKVNGVPMSDVMFNLNDRGSMTYSMLIGKNVLQRGGFLIDPKLDESETEIISEEEMINGLDLDALTEQLMEIQVPKRSDDAIIDLINFITNR